MSATSSSRLLDELERCRYRFGRAEAAHISKLLKRAQWTSFRDVSSLIRFHEVLMVLRAFPPSLRVMRQCEKLLNTFWRRVEQLRESGADMDEFDPLEVSGIAGTTMQDTVGFDLMRWLVGRMPGKVEIAWDDYDDERAMGAGWPRVIPLLEEDSLVEATIPWRKWLDAAQGSPSKSPAWVVKRFDELDLPDAEKARVYDALHIPVRWHLENSRISRTRNWRAAGQPFIHQEPLIVRKDVSLARELAQRPPDLTRLSRTQGQAVTDRIREVMLVRYRELYGTTLGDAGSVRRADVGRGVSIFLWNLQANRRLPLRAYVAGLTLKNGVPINYIEAIGLFEWIEVGFNTFYTFRGGEAAWIFAQVLRCLCRLTGAKCVSMYPYQLGQNNDEAIESGAFWFYRKLGFRPGRTDLLRLAEREEEKIARDPKYKTSARVLRRLADGHVFYELPNGEVGTWDSFSTRNIGLRVNARMARESDGDAARFRRAAAGGLARNLGVRVPPEDALEYGDFCNFGMVLTLVPEVKSWTPVERRSLLEIIRAKSGRDEMRYLRLLQKHKRLRAAMLKLGSERLVAGRRQAGSDFEGSFLDLRFGYSAKSTTKR
jgi:hypothetical protein